MTFKFKVKAHVTVPLLKINENGTPIYVTFTGPIHTAKENEATATAARAKGETYKAPQIAQVTNLETGEVQQIVVGSILESELNENYPNDGYVGKSFSIAKMSAKEGKRYKVYQVAEIEVEHDGGDDAPTSKSKK